jgi:LmbE family N-acetylglucosaminyl deacetylase
VVAGPAWPGADQPQSPFIGNLEPINRSDRILILAPHPDDETIGCAGIIQEAVKKNANVKIVYLTNGDHNQIAFIVYEKRIPIRTGEFIHLGEVRRREAVKAMELLGVDKKNLVFLGYPDFGTFTIFRKVWKDAKPYRSILTRISRVPYKENFSFGAPYKGENILADLKKILKEYKPNKIFVSHPADTNVDHKAFYLFLQVALQDLKKEIPQPKIYPYLIHCAGWPLPRHYHPELGLTPPKKFSGSQIEWKKFKLSPERIEKKHRAVLCYKSQTSSSAFYLLSFVRKNELFGGFPEIELDRTQELKDKIASYLGLSNLFSDLNPELLTTDSEGVIKNRGEVNYSLKDNNLLIRVDKTSELNKRFGMQLYLFGYSDKTPFALMPKIRIITRYKNLIVFDGARKISSDSIGLELNPNEAILKVPLKILGQPDFILATIKTYSESSGVDTASFREINIK